MVINDKYLPYIDDKSRFLILFGGGGSGKSVFAAQKVIKRVLEETNHKFLCLRKVGSTIKDSVWLELQGVIHALGIDEEFNKNLSSRVFTHMPTGNIIQCVGLDDPEKIKSIKGVTGMWLEETTEFTEEDIDQLNIRIRGQKEHYIQYIMTFNPIDENHFLRTKFIELSRDDVSYVHSTYKDNAFLSLEDKQVLEDYKETNPLFYMVYCLGEWGVVDTSGKFLHAFNSRYHVSKTHIDKHQPLRLSFDFNIDPFTCIAYQREDDQLSVHQEMRLATSDIYQMCELIRSKYPQSEYFYVVTGDRTGYNQTGVVRGKTSYWKIIKKELSLKDSQIRLRSRNLDLLESRVLCNAVLQHKDVAIDPSCKELVQDCLYSRVDNIGLLVKDRVKNKNDFLDCFRYAMDIEWPEITRRP